MTAESRFNLSEHLRQWAQDNAIDGDSSPELLKIKNEVYAKRSQNLELTEEEIRVMMDAFHSSPELKSFCLDGDRISEFVNYLITHKSSIDLFVGLVDVLCDASMVDDEKKESFFAAYPPSKDELNCAGGTASRLNRYKEQLRSSAESSIMQNGYVSALGKVSAQLVEGGLHFGNEVHIPGVIAAMTHREGIKEIHANDEYGLLPIGYIPSGEAFGIADGFGEIYRRQLVRGIESEVGEAIRGGIREVVKEGSGEFNEKLFGEEEGAEVLNIKIEPEPEPGVEAAKTRSIKVFVGDVGREFSEEDEEGVDYVNLIAATSLLNKLTMGGEDVNASDYIVDIGEGGDIVYQFKLGDLRKKLITDELEKDKYRGLNLLDIHEGKVTLEPSQLSPSDIYSEDIKVKIAELLKPGDRDEDVNALHSRWAYAIDILYSMSQSTVSAGSCFSHFIDIVSNDSIRARLEQINHGSYLHRHYKEKISSGGSRGKKVELGILDLYGRDREVKTAKSSDSTEKFKAEIAGMISQNSQLQDDLFYDNIVSRSDFHKTLEGIAITPKHVKNLVKAAIRKNNSVALKYVMENLKGKVTISDLHEMLIIKGEKMFCEAVNSSSKSFKNSLLHKPEEGGINLIYDAMRFGNKEATKVLLPDFNATRKVGKIGSLPIHIAAISGKSNMVKFSIDKGQDKDVEDRKRKTPLFYAATYGHVNVVKDLLLLGANTKNSVGRDVSQIRTTDMISLYLFAAKTQLTPYESQNFNFFLKEVKEGGQDIDYGSLMKIAVGKGNLEVMESLLRDNFEVSKATIVELDQGRIDEFFSQAATAQNKNLLMALIEAGAVLNQDLPRYNIGLLQILLLKAIEEGKIKVVEALIKYDLDLNVVYNGYVEGKSIEEGTLLHLAAYYGHEDIAELLLENSPDLLIKTTKLGSLPIHLAAISGKSNMVEFLIKKKQIKDVEDIGGKTPLMVAAMQGNVNVVKDLLLLGANTKNSAGHDVSQIRTTDMISLYLLAAKTELTVDNSRNFNLLLDKVKEEGRPIDYESLTKIAVGKGNSEAMEYLLRDNFEVAIEAGATLTTDVVAANKEFFQKLLLKAIKEDKIQVVRSLIERGLDRNIRCDNNIKGLNIKNATPLHLAAYYGHEDIAELLLENSPDLLIKATKLGSLPIHLAAISGKSNMVEFLIKKKQIKDVEDIGGKTPLMVAAMQGNVNVVKDLLLLGANTKNSAGRDASQITRRPMVLLYLLAAKTELTVDNSRNFNLLLDKVKEEGRPIDYESLTKIAVGKGNSEAMEYLLRDNFEVSKAAIIELDQGKVDELFSQAVTAKNMNLMIALIEAGATLGADILVDEAGQLFISNLLEMAVNLNKGEVVKSILLYNPEIAGFVRNEDGAIGAVDLYLAVSRGQVLVVNAIINNPEFEKYVKEDVDLEYLIKIAINSRNLDVIWCLLMEVVKDKNNDLVVGVLENEEVLRMLRIDKSHINAIDNDTGKTPLDIAISQGNNKLVALLIAAGADVNQARVSDGATYLHIATSMGDDKLVDMLIKAGADVNEVRSSDGATSLHVATSQGSNQLVDILIEAKVGIHQRDKKGKSAVEAAVENANVGIVKLLLSKGAKMPKIPSSRKEPIAQKEASKELRGFVAQVKKLRNNLEKALVLKVKGLSCRGKKVKSAEEIKAIMDNVISASGNYTADDVKTAALMYTESGRQNLLKSAEVEDRLTPDRLESLCKHDQQLTVGIITVSKELNKKATWRRYNKVAPAAGGDIVEKKVDRPVQRAFFRDDATSGSATSVIKKPTIRAAGKGRTLPKLPSATSGSPASVIKKPTIRAAGKGRTLPKLPSATSGSPASVIKKPTIRAAGKGRTLPKLPSTTSGSPASVPRKAFASTILSPLNEIQV